MSILKIGFNVFSNKIEQDHPSFTLPLKKGKADFVVCHFSPDAYTVEDACRKIRQVIQKCRDRGLEILVNHEFQNSQLDCKGKDGYDWGNTPDGCHRLNLHEDYIRTLAREENCIGIMYDEFEHTIINRNLSLELSSKGRTKLSVFPLYEGKNMLGQAKKLNAQLRDYAQKIRENGVKCLCGEHVFPVLFHTFAKNGITPNFKSQKESYSNVQYACAAGAALQYGTQLFNCVDLWYRNTNPGHSPSEMYHNLVFAFLSGVDRVYVETSHRFVDDPGKKKKKDENEDSIYNAYGENFSRFTRDFSGIERGYSIHDYRPETGIIKFDDSFWGQRDPVMWKYMLFGNRCIKPAPASREWLRAMHILTRGETSRNSVSWDKVSPWSLRRHRSFASMTGTAVFDDTVRRQSLESLRLCFLCGEMISRETLEDVAALVRENGLTVVTTQKHLPAALRSELKNGCGDISDGKGRWIIERDLASRSVKRKVKPFLAEKGEMRFRYGEKTVRMKIDRDGNGFTVLKCEK